MQYIVYDLEFNQDLSDRKLTKCFFEIIQIGAVKLDSDLNKLAEFNRYVKPTVYKNINPFITELTGITAEQLQHEKPFPEVYEDYIHFIGEGQTVFCIWGMSDIKELFRNVEYLKLNQQLLSRLFINLQPYVAKQIDLPPRKLPQLKSTVEAMDIPMVDEFHNALHDARYTSEIFKKLDRSSIVPKYYDPAYIIPRPGQKRKEIDFERLLRQFEKMFQRAITHDEQEMVKLAYKMGKTGQFLKE